MRELHALGAWVHGALTFGHLIGVIYNVRRGNRFDVVAHVAWMVYDLKSMVHHQRIAGGSRG